MALLDTALFVLTLFFLQEGIAQRNSPGVIFPVVFPQNLMPLAWISLFLLICNFTIITLVLLKGLYRRRWPWVTTLIVGVLLGVIVQKLGFSDTWSIIKPSSAVSSYSIGG